MKSAPVGTNYFDLGALEARLKADARYAELAKALAIYRSNQSVRRDLADAQFSMRILAQREAEERNLPPGTDHRTRGIISQGLFVSALMLYCRATHSTSDDRFLGRVMKAYTLAQREAHKEITTLRDKVQAHFGYGADRAEGPWVKEAIVLEATPTTVKIKTPYVKSLYRARESRMLIELIEVAHTELMAKLPEMERMVVDMTVALVNADAEFRSLVESTAFDPEAFFSEAGSVDAFYSGAKQVGSTWRHRPDV